MQLFREFALTLKYHTKLNPKVWKRGKLPADLEHQLLTTAYEFAEFSGVDRSRIRDIIITGSNANFNYTKFSDIDVHIVSNINGLDSNELYNKKVKWTNSHNLKYNGFPLEFYIHDEKQGLSKDQGQFSLLKDKWLVEPQNITNAKQILSDPTTITKVQSHIKLVKSLIKQKNNRDDIISFKMRMWKGRSAGLQRDGEFSLENIIYKDLRNRGLIDRLNEKLHQLNEYHEEEGGTFADEGDVYDINKIFDIVENKPIKNVRVADLVWIEPKKIPKVDLEREKNVNLKYPIIIAPKNGKLLVVDGYHRMLKAEAEGIKFLPAKLISKKELSTAKIN